MQIGQLTPSCIRPGLIRLHWNCASCHWPLAEVSMFRTLFLLFTLFSCPAFAQQVGFGVKGGVRATHDIEGSFCTSSESSRDAVGPMVEATLPHGFGADADALYSPFHYHSILSYAFSLST